ncbi:MBL fold metallo-hydrolase [Gemmatimonadota bacterium]
MTQDATFTLTLLGTGAAYPPPERENTSIALQWPGGIWLIDCGASPHRRLRQAGLDPGRLRGVVVTHGHPDHLYGLPSLVHCLLPAPRSEPLPLLAPPLTLARARAILDAFDLGQRDELPLDFVEIPLDAPPSTPIIEVDGLALYTAEVQHSQEAVGVRAEAGGRVLAYTGDTMPCEGVEALAGGSHTLVHEATFLTSAEVAPGHSTARDAGLAAQRAGVETLILVHFLEETARDIDALAKEAADVFDGRVIVGEDLAHYAI